MTSLPLPQLTVEIPRHGALTLRIGEVNDCEAIVDYFSRNRAHFAPTDPPHPEGFFTTEFWKTRVKQYLDEFNADQTVRLFIFDEKNKRILGATNYTQIFRGPMQACYVGYGLDQDEQSKGIMTHALQAGIEYMFNVKNLHRIMANHLPENTRSANVLKRLGFQVDGLAKEYLLIHGAWRDHVLNSLVNSNWRSS
jgi:ribosomal-protein-alanine N-acetyltransferase